jgi:threonine aldolase
MVGQQDLINRARRTRKALGGGMRQSGILAAAGLQAIQDFHDGILVNDHVRAKRLAQGISKIKGFKVDVSRVETNILLVEICHPEDARADKCDANKVVQALKEQGVLCFGKSHKVLRLVTHRDLTDDDIEVAINSFQTISENIL